MDRHLASYPGLLADDHALQDQRVFVDAEVSGDCAEVGVLEREAAVCWVEDVKSMTCAPSSAVRQAPMEMKRRTDLVDGLLLWSSQVALLVEGVPGRRRVSVTRPAKGE